MKDPYSVLGLPADTPEEELRAKYEELKAKYGEQRFRPGNVGNEGARKLSELEDAWGQITADLDKQKEKETFGDDEYGAIDDLLKKGSYDEAQARLDAASDRTARWHYLQSILFYKREWLTESRKQLEIAVQMDPDNAQYKTALEKLDLVIGNPKVEAATLGPDPNVPPPQQPEGQVCGGNALSNCCLAYCLTDCCCNMMRCCG